MNPLFPVYELMASKCVEPVKRMVGGEYGYAVHRFPIKGGIAFRDAMLDAITPTKTPMLSLLLGSRKRRHI